MSFLFRSAVVAAGVCMLTGCLSVKSYVDPGLHDLAWSEVKAPAQAHAVALDIAFYRNGERLARADTQVRGAVERALGKSGVVVLKADGTTARLAVKVDNIANLAEARKKGFGTGLTFGGKGSTVTDGYQITISYQAGGQSVEKSYTHSLHTTVGNAKPVTAAAPLSMVQGFDVVIEDAVIHFLRDMQAEGQLVLRDGRLQVPRA
jgi:hypothetical protein